MTIKIPMAQGYVPKDLIAIIHFRVVGAPFFTLSYKGMTIASGLLYSYDMVSNIISIKTPDYSGETFALTFPKNTNGIIYSLERVRE